jgi:ArsR family transcriptional regulator, arsenate/arsenite/antimonite-responsive transcriptional repressor
MREIIKVFKVLADETRLRILNLLLERECCVCEVIQALEISQSKASRGLTTLYDTGLLQLKKEGLWSLYSINKEDMPDYQMKVIEAMKEALVDNKLTVLDRERLKKAERGHSRRESSLADNISFKPTSV